MNKTAIKRCQEDQDILDGKTPGVIVELRDALEKNEKYWDSILMPRVDFEKKWSLYYKLHPEEL
jgi:hypothetical protein